ncbi:MAG TPA: C25 family cysteine peptidase [Verrucomicrobiae bacterium]|nr:C25 family cysteine peptidase [Verrucomicrobiae bacterium]
MSELQVRKDSRLFAELCEALLRRGDAVQFRVSGASMQPNLVDGDDVLVTAAKPEDLHRGDVVLARNDMGFQVHRVVQVSADNAQVITRGDSGQKSDSPAQHILGKVIAAERRGKRLKMAGLGARVRHSLRILVHRAKLSSIRRFKQVWSISVLGGLAVCVGLLTGSSVFAQALTITNTASPTSVLQGGTITYTQVLSNTSGVRVNGAVTVTQNVPAGTTYASAGYAGTGTWTCGQAGGVITCTDAANYASGSTTTFTITVTASTTITAGTTITDTVNAKGSNTSTVSSTATVTVPPTDLYLNQTVTPSVVAPSTNYTYAEFVGNNGPTIAASGSVTVSTQTPTNATYQSYSGTNWSCTTPAVGGAGNIVCTYNAALAANAAATTLSITMQVSAGTTSGTVIQNSATVGDTQFTDPYPPNNTDTDSITVAPAGTADLQLTQTASPDSVSAGSQYVYSEIVADNGPTATTSGTVTVSTQTPTNTVYEAYAGTNWTCTTPAVGSTGNIVCTYNAAMAAGATANTLTVTVQVNAGTANGTLIQNSATVNDSALTDPITSNNTSTTTVTVEAAGTADLQLTQVASANAVAAGGTYVYTDTVIDNGPTAAASGTVTVYMQTPPNTTYQSFTGTNWTCGTNPGAGGVGPVICTYGATLASGGMASALAITFQVNSGTAAGTTIQSSATVTNSTLVDPIPANNTSITSIVVEPATSSDLALTMSVAPTPVFISSNLTYTLQVQNLGQLSAPVTSNVLTDTLPSGVTLVSVTPSAGWSCSGTSTISCSITAAMPMGATATIAITVTTPASASTLTNTATLSLTGDPNSANNSATAYTVVQPLVCATPGKDGAGGTLTGVVNAYYPPSGTGTLAAGSTSVALGPAAASGAQKAIAVGDLLLIIQMQAAAINDANTSSYGDGVPGDPGSGSTNVSSSGLFEFVTATSAVAVTGGTLQFVGTGTTGGLLNNYYHNVATATQGAQTYQIIRVPQYTSATLSSGLVPLAWNGSVGGVLAIDAASQLTLGGTVAADALGFRGGGGVVARGGTGANTDYVTVSPANLPNLSGGEAPAGSGTNGSKGEGIAGTPHWIAPALSTITATTTAVSSGQTAVEGLPAGSYARGAPGNAGGGGTDGDPANNDYNSGGGAGGNGGSGGQGGYGWNSMASTNSTDGGFGGVVFPASTSALVMGGAGGAGTTNDGSYYIAGGANGADCGTSCTGIYSSGGAGGGIVIIHAGSVTGTGAITSSGQSTLSTLNDGTGGAGAGGSILVFANSGGLSGLTVSATGGSGGNAWPTEAPGGFPGQRHGPGGGGGGGVIFLSAAPASSNVAGGNNGYTDTVQDSYGATPGQPGVVVTTDIITETPGAQPGAYCASADLSVTNSGAPLLVAPGADITYTQTVTNNGPMDGVNVVFSEGIPANTTYQSMTYPAGWTCSTPAVGGTGNITCTDPDLGNAGTGNFTVVVAVGNGTASGTQITDVDNVTSGTSDPNLANNTAIAVNTVSTGTQADLAVTNTVTVPTVTAGTNFTMTAVVTNNGPATASSVVFTEATASNSAGTVNATFVSMVVPSGWSCSTPTAGTTGTISCTVSSLALNGTATFAVVMAAPASAPSGTALIGAASIAASTPDPNTGNNLATASVTVAAAGQDDLAVTSTGTPNPVTPGNNITYTQSVINNGPIAITASGTTTVTFTDAIPSGTTLASTFTAPAGWTCNTIAVGATGTFTCTLNSGQTLAVNAVVNFPLVVKVNAGTAGTTITNSPNIASSVSDPNTTNNTATVQTLVASPTQADVSIVKTASPNPVNQGTTLTYTLTVFNAGPAVSQNVVVTDPIPGEVTYNSSSTTNGSCTYTASTTTVSCSLGNLSVNSTAVVTINVLANTFSATSGSTNTATVSATTSDPNLSNNSSSFTSIIQASTAVDVSAFNAYALPDGTVRLVWHTQEESRNLGFHVYREDGAGRHRVDTAMIAGSALLLRGSKPQHAAKTYAAIDAQGVPNGVYYLEDVDINGTRTLHGPAYPEAVSTEQLQSAGNTQSLTAAPLSPSLSKLNTQMRSVGGTAHAFLVPRQVHPRPISPAPPDIRLFNAADQAAVKISVNQEGWYHIPFSQLFAAGLPSSTELSSLHLYAEGIEQPILLVGHNVGFPAPTDAIEFYGTGIDTPFSANRVYWLVSETSAGKRIFSSGAGFSEAPGPASFPYTTILEDRTVYFAALLNGENSDNFFGAVVTSEPIDQTLNVDHRDASSSQPLTLTIALQGVTDQQQHDVTVQFNGASLGTVDFYGQVLTTQSFSIDASQVVDGTNTVTLTALDGDYDVSAVQSIQLQYMHTYAANSDWLQASAPAGTGVHISGFSNAQVRVFDITNPQSIVELPAKVAQEENSYSALAELPATNTGIRTILALGADTLASPASIEAHTPTLLDQERTGADIVMISYPEFASHLAPLVNLRESQGHRVQVVTTEQIFDDFNFGERSPFAIRSFLQNAAARWQHKPQAVLLVGDASMDPRNYLGFGDFDFVPTRIIETAALKTASDDWFTDFLENGYATIPTGRLPARTTSDVDVLVSKIVGYEQGEYAGSWNTQAVLIADQNVDANFTSAAASAAATLPSSLLIYQILADGADPGTVHSQIVTALNNGALLVDYNGHGAEQQWSFVDLFDNNDVAALSNGGRLPVYLLIDCLNGLFQDVYAESLSKALILAPNGGGVAVWASSGFTNEPPQASMDLALLQQMAASPNDSLGLMILRAKKVTTDNDVRRTWILFGDPSMRLHYAPSGGTTPNVRPSVDAVAATSPPRNCSRGFVCPKERE